MKRANNNLYALSVLIFLSAFSLVTKAQSSAVFTGDPSWGGSINFKNSDNLNPFWHIAGPRKAIGPNMPLSFFYHNGTNWSAPYLSLSVNGNIGIGTETPNGQLQLVNSMANRKIVLWENGNNDHQYYGFGINNSTLRYQTSAPNDDHVFFAGIDATASRELLRIKGNGNVGIGTANPDAKLTVAGNIKAREVEVRITAGADFVFAKDYALPLLSEVEKFVRTNKHLPGIQSEKEMQENGLNLNQMNIKLLQKVEELTLYVIEQQKKIDMQQAQIQKQQTQINQLIAQAKK
jgi:Phage T4 tail fibre